MNYGNHDNEQVARVVETKNPDYAKGKIVVGSMGWCSYSVVDPSITQVCGRSMITIFMVMIIMIYIDLGSMGWCSCCWSFNHPSMRMVNDHEVEYGWLGAARLWSFTWLRNSVEPRCIWWSPFQGRIHHHRSLSTSLSPLWSWLSGSWRQPVCPNLQLLVSLESLDSPPTLVSWRSENLRWSWTWSCPWFPILTKEGGG